MIASPLKSALPVSARCKKGLKSQILNPPRRQIMEPAPSQPRVKRLKGLRTSSTRLPPAARQRLLNCKPLKLMKSAAGLKNQKSMPKRNWCAELQAMTWLVVSPIPHCLKRPRDVAARLRKQYRVVRHAEPSRVAAASQAK